MAAILPLGLGMILFPIVGIITLISAIIVLR